MGRRRLGRRAGGGLAPARARRRRGPRRGAQNLHRGAGAPAQANATTPPAAAPPAPARNLGPAPVPQEWATATSGNRASRRAASAAAPKAPARAATSPGFVFLCNRLSRGEVRDRKLFGLGKGQLRDMEKHITANTPLFLYDFDAKTLTGPCTPDGAPSLDIDRAHT